MLLGKELHGNFLCLIALIVVLIHNASKWILNCNSCGATCIAHGLHDYLNFTVKTFRARALNQGYEERGRFADEHGFMALKL